MIATLRREGGQVTVLTAIFMVVLVGMAGFVLDVGSWFRQQRVSQSTVDAAALAGAQSLPADSTTARSLATSFANKNGGVAGATITIGSRFTPNDMITVAQKGNGTGFFSQVLGTKPVTIHATASAISEVPSQAFGVAPIAVDIKHKMLSGPGCPCFGIPTTIPLGKKGVPGAFGMIDLDTQNGNTGSSVLATWITSGYKHYLPLGDYDSDPGAKFDSSQIQSALIGRYGSDLLFPIYDSLTGNGSNASYNIVAWAAFHLSKVDASGNDGTLSGWFDRVIWEGLIPPTGPSGAIPDLGVHSVALIN